MIDILIASLVVMLAALGGAVAFWQSAGRLINRHLALLISFSAGLFLVVSYELAREALAHSPTAGPALLWILAGMFLVWLPFKLWPFFHHHHDSDLETEPHSHIDVRRILTGNSLHNVGDGVLLTAAFAVNPAIGVATAISVFVHELVQETSTFFVLRQAGYRIASALLINLAVSGSILIGAVGGYWALETFTALETPLLGLSAGAFLVVVLIDLIPHSWHASQKGSTYLPHLAAFLIGLLTMSGLAAVAGHSHDHDHDHQEDHHEPGADHDHDHQEDHYDEHHSSKYHNR